MNYWSTNRLISPFLTFKRTLGPPSHLPVPSTSCLSPLTQPPPLSPSTIFLSDKVGHHTVIVSHPFIHFFCMITFLEEEEEGGKEKRNHFNFTITIIINMTCWSEILRQVASHINLVKPRKLKKNYSIVCMRDSPSH